MPAIILVVPAVKLTACERSSVPHTSVKVELLLIPVSVPFKSTDGAV